MKDIMRITEIIKKKIEENYADDVAIFAYYGSYATGHHDDLSDLDFFFIPKTDRGRELNIQFIIDGIGFDLFPIAWERVGRIAALNQPITAVITKAQVLYSASQEDLERFTALKNGLESLFDEKHLEVMLGKANEYLNDAALNMSNMYMNTSDLTATKMEAEKMLVNLLYSIAFINCKYYTRGMGMAVKEALGFEKLPEQFEELVSGIIMSTTPDHVISKSQSLIDRTRILLGRAKNALADREPYETLFAGYYEELKSGLNKIVRACNEEDHYTAFFRSAFTQDELGQFLGKAEKGLWYSSADNYCEYSSYYDELLGINLLDSVTDLSTLKNKVEQLDEKLKSFLLSNGVDILEFDNIKAFESHYTGE